MLEPVLNDPYAVDKTRFAEAYLGVKIRIDSVLSGPITRKSLLEHPELKELGIIKFPNATNFIISDQENDAIQKLIQRRPQRTLSLLGTAKNFEDQYDRAISHIQRTGGWSTWWSFIINERAQDVLAIPFYLYLNAGHGKVFYRFEISDYVSSRGSEGIVSPWPDLTFNEERDRTKLGDTQNHICKSWLKVTKIEKIDPPLNIKNFSPYEPYSNENNLLNQNAFGYVCLEDVDINIIPNTVVDIESNVVPILSPDSIAQSFSMALKDSHVDFGSNHDQRVNAFVSSLMTKPLVILTGLSGSGKTQIAIRFGEWLGKDRMYVAAVRPDWTGAEALFGYEDALKPVADGRSAWAVPDTLRFMLRAVADSDYPYLLVLDEMNLAHVERYFADVLSGMESEQACLPNLHLEVDGHWRLPSRDDEKIPFPKNVFIVGTVNVDETTYMFSPKVLDRANTFEFRVQGEDLADEYIKPIACAAGEVGLVRGFLEIGSDDSWHRYQEFTGKPELSKHLRDIHALLSRHGLEFGHRVFYESQRFAAIYFATGDADTLEILDLIVMQKLLPRLHGSRRRLEDLLRSFAEYCYFGELAVETEASRSTFEPEHQDGKTAKLPNSYDKLARMLKGLLANQFTSFTE